jgi:hypothetical protein
MPQVLIIPEANSLTVPEVQGSSVFAWEEKWLQPFEAAHGALPPAVAYFVSGDSQSLAWTIVALKASLPSLLGVALDILFCSC